MEATINQNGTLIITAKTEIESYALTKWIEENYNEKGITRVLPSLDCQLKHIKKNATTLNILIDAEI